MPRLLLCSDCDVGIKLKHCIREKVDEVSYLAARMVNIVKDVVYSDFLFSSSSETHQHYF